MIYLATALYAEAAPFIQTLGLKKKETHTRFQLFVSDTHVLIVTGSGSLNAAIADTWLLSHYPPDPGRDVFAQIGTCGAPFIQGTDEFSVGNLYLCHKLTDSQTGRSYYPDMLYGSDFAEAELTTWPDVQAGMTTLSDMEAYGGYQAVSVFFPPHRIFTWKVVSDYGCLDPVAPHTILSLEKLRELITPHVQSILSWLQNLTERTPGTPTSDEDLTLKHFPMIWQLADQFGYSVTQRTQLTQLLRYAALTGQTEPILLKGLLDSGATHRAQTKQEGKRILHELEQRILS